jgi:hypothetical protein
MTDWGVCPDCASPVEVLIEDKTLGEAGPVTLVCTDEHNVECPWTLQLPEQAKAGSRIEQIREVHRTGTAKRVEGFLLDIQTAGALVAVYDALSPRSRRKFGDPPLDRVVDFAWKHVVRA